MKYPEDLEIPINIVQQIQISHDFVAGSNITIKEKDWNSISYYNEEKELIIVLVLDKYDDASDFNVILEEFNKELALDLNEADLKEQIDIFFNLSLNVFRARDEVISKLSNDVASLKMMEYDYEKKLEQMLSMKDLNVKTKILLILIANDSATLEELKTSINSSDGWVEKVVKSLEKRELIEYNPKDESYYFVF